MKKLVALALALALMLMFACVAYGEQAEPIEIGEYTCTTPEGWTATETAENYYTYTLDEDTAMVVQYFTMADMGVTRDDFADLGLETDFDVVELYYTVMSNATINEDGDTMYATVTDSYATAGEGFTMVLYHGALNEALMAGNYAACLVLSADGLFSVQLMGADFSEEAAVETLDAFLEGVFSGETCLGEYTLAEYTPAAISEEELEAAVDTEAVEEAEVEAEESAIGGGLD